MPRPGAPRTVRPTETADGTTPRAVEETTPRLADDGEPWRAGLEQTLARKRQQENRLRLSESIIWFFIPILIAWPFWVELLFSFDNADSFTDGLRRAIANTDSSVLVAILVLIFPRLFRLVFGLLPLAHIRQTRAASIQRAREKDRAAAQRPSAVPDPDPDSEGDRFEFQSEPKEFLAALVRSSRVLSQRIFTRAGVYLSVGVLIAFGGVFFFYLQTLEPPPSAADDVFAEAIRNAPRFGILFFVEFIAIFFLRQYRSDMEEFRYYEAIQRKRENAFFLVRAMEKHDEKVNIDRLVDIINHSFGVGKLATGETTELLETKKLSKDETDVLVKIIEAVTKFQKN